jgi:serine protease Do
MDHQSNTSPHAPQSHAPRKILRPRRLTLLASVAALSMAVLVVGPGCYRPLGWMGSAHAAETTATQNSAGFADLVAKVKPAVISVRVKIDGDSDNTAVSQRGDEDTNPDQSGSPFDQFSQQFGFRVPNGMPQHHQMITGEGFTYVKFADQPPRVGDWVVAVGNPFGLGGTVTAGIVSAHGRDIGAGPYDDYVQIDAPINKGNSGSPAFDVNGNVIGVNTAIYSPSGGSVGIGFDIPAGALGA